MQQPEQTITRDQGADELREILLSWWSENARPFPWRSRNEPVYRLVVTEVLLQRTTATAVSRIYQGFFCEFGSWEALAEADPDKLEAALRPIGLWRRRAGSMQSLARWVVGAEGRFPADRTSLTRIPAVGHYVAAAVTNFCHGGTEPLIDSNVARFFKRYQRVGRLVDYRYDRDLYSVAKGLISKGDPVKNNWALLDFCALVCKPRRPACSKCPLAENCRYPLSSDRELSTSS